ncbi:aminotransferase class I/II-fold pyridoxal phosphate-dependent enzyme [Streptomyces buecherae]|uniref:aminotransferase class I/II-fold pyridoxal phosphate-dependent enzyme n=1 Tax=Streptomyces buecherae TaxID=2763006 RepID=UPI001C254EA9|nr:aminotransferase class I/II-fold pyridoxal phosphate-dependent enzyme [Streptomyces buecherae]
MTSVVRPGRDARPARRVAAAGRHGLRGTLTDEARELSVDGRPIIDLGLGDPAAHGIPAPPSVLTALHERIDDARGYSDAAGHLTARTAVAEHFRTRLALPRITPSDVRLGNGVSELALLTLQALLDPGDEVLVPDPGYPMWAAYTSLCAGSVVPYPCPEANGWRPDLDSLSRLAGPRTRALVVINPVNPTGAVWPPETLDGLVAVARRHGLVLFSDEIYDGIRFVPDPHVPLAALAPDLLCLTFGGLSKLSRLPGLRAGWVVASHPPGVGRAYLAAVASLAALRLGPNSVGQYAIPAALSAPALRDAAALTEPGGALHQSRSAAHTAIDRQPGLRCAPQDGTFYAFPRLDLPPGTTTNEFARRLLREKSVLAMPGQQFGSHSDLSTYLRLTTLAPPTQTTSAIERIGDLLAELWTDHTGRSEATARPKRS